MPKWQDVSHGSNCTPLCCMITPPGSWISVICADFSLCKHFQGFTAVTDIAGGFSSWRDTKLPITQRPELASSYIPEAQHPVNVA